MINSKILKLIYNKNNFIKFLIVCILAYIIYLLYNNFNKINEGFGSNQTTSPATYTEGVMDTWSVPQGVTSATFTVIGGRGGNSQVNAIGGFGGIVTTTIPVLEGDIYNIYVLYNYDHSFIHSFIHLFNNH